MGLLLSIIGCFIAIIAAVTYVSIMMHDIKKIQQERTKQSRKRKPHYRSQPFVSVIVNDDVSDICLESIALSDYQKHDIYFAGEPVDSDITLTLGRDAILDRSAISQGIQDFSVSPARAFIELKPVIPAPRLPQHVFRLYMFVVAAPFISLRAVFNIRPFSRPRWPVMRKRSIPHKPWRSYIYRTLCWLVALVNAVALAYVSYIAVVLGQPEMLFIYIAVFFVWLIVGIWDYPHFSVREKFAYSILAPVSLGYFWIAAMYAPLAPFVRQMGKIIAGIFWRSYNLPVVQSKIKKEAIHE